MLRFWADFHEVEHGDRLVVSVSMSAATPLVPIDELSIGYQVVLQDSDGHELEATIEGQSGDWLVTRLDWDTWTVKSVPGDVISGRALPRQVDAHGIADPGPVSRVLTQVLGVGWRAQ
jgi:hypothetical protein